MNSSYTPVDPDFYDVLQELYNLPLRIHFFNTQNHWDSCDGKANGVMEEEGGEYLSLSESCRVRLDRIITIGGRPGPAYDEFHALGNACLDCNVQA